AASVNNVGNVVLNGGSISGNGAAGPVTGTPIATAPAVGAINPGANSTTPTTGILTVNGNVRWGPSSVFFVDLGNSSGNHPNPIPGRDYDRLFINGSVDINNALLQGNVLGTGVQATPISDSFTILHTTGTVTGLFTGNNGVSPNATIANGGV